MDIARMILDGIVMCVVFNAVVGMFFFVFPQAYSTMFPRGMRIFHEARTAQKHTACADRLCGRRHDSRIRLEPACSGNGYG